MPRSKEGKTRPHPSKANLQGAKDAIDRKIMSQREAAKRFNVSRATLQRYLKQENTQPGSYTSYVKCAVKRVFTTIEETDLCKYLIVAAKMHYGLQRNQLRILAYQFAKSNNKTVPKSWEEKQKAGKNWFRYFMRRHPDLSLRKPEATSLSRATSFNKHNVSLFFSKLKTVMQEYKFEPMSIYNMDETGNSTVHVPGRVIAVKGEKQVGSATSGERGINVTMIACINAVGNSIPPMFIFPRVHFKETIMMHGAPSGAKGTAIPSGWINSDIFLEWMKHFINHAKPSLDDKKLLILDNHETHLTYEAVSLAKEKGTVMLTMPPHTSHKFQPLDRTVFGPYKRYYNTAAEEWMLSHPATPLTIYNVAELAGKAYPLAFNPKNIQAGFRVTGIYPFDENVFGEDEFLCSAVTDRENPNLEPLNISNIEQPPQQENQNPEPPERSLINEQPPQQKNPKPSTSTDLYRSPSEIRPLPKAAPRKSVNKRKKGSCRILTDTPEKDEIERLYLERQQKQAKNIRFMAKQKAVKKKVFAESSSSDSSELEYSSASETDSNFSFPKPDSPDLNQHLAEKKFCLTKVEGKKKVHYYVAEIIEIHGNELRLKYLKRYKNTYKFIREKEDIYDSARDDVVMVLPDPDMSGSARQQNMMSFGVDFSSFLFDIE